MPSLLIHIAPSGRNSKRSAIAWAVMTPQRSHERSNSNTTPFSEVCGDRYTCAHPFPVRVTGLNGSRSNHHWHCVDTRACIRGRLRARNNSPLRNRCTSHDQAP